MYKATISIRKVKTNPPPVDDGLQSEKKNFEVNEKESILIASASKKYFLGIVSIGANAVRINTDSLVIFLNQESVQPSSGPEIVLRAGQTAVLIEAPPAGDEMWEIGLVTCVEKGQVPPKIEQTNNLPPSELPPVAKTPSENLQSSPPENKQINNIANSPVEENQFSKLKEAVDESLMMQSKNTRNTMEQKPSTGPKIRFPKVNWKETQTIISSLEERFKSKVICYFTASNTHMNEYHADFFLDHIRKMGEQEKISLVLVSYGGGTTSPLRISGILRDSCKTLEIIIPGRCASAATILSLCADKIIMSPGGFLTAIDCSVTHELNPKEPGSSRPVSVSVDQVKRILKFLNDEGPVKDKDGINEGAYRTLFKYLHPLAVAEIDRTSSGSERIAIMMMKMHLKDFGSEEKVVSIAKRLNYDYPTHGFPILFNEAKEIGLPVEKADKETSNILWDLVKLYNSTTLLQTTSLAPDYYHGEGFPVIIESKDLRTSYMETYNKRFNPVNKLWNYENDQSRWVNFKPSKSSDKSFDLFELDATETAVQEGEK